MPSSLQVFLQKVLRIVISLIPWALSLYLHYWLEYGGIWEVDMPYRSLASGGMIAIGMTLSFVLYARLSRR